MKKNILILLAAVTLLGTSCDEFLNVNEVNPNNPSVVAAKLVLPAALNNVANTMNNPRRFDFVYLWHGLWSISAGYSQPQNLVQYRLINSNYQNAFLEFYTTGNNFDLIEKSSTDPKDVYYLAVAKIMKAYIFQNLVDCWGNVPYSQAFKASAGNLKPAYDDQQAIYEDLVLQLDAAIAAIQAAPTEVNVIPAASDIIYAGDMNKWMKFANTLKLRILVHQADIPGRTTYITNAIATTASVGYIGAGEGALVNPGYVVSEGKMNPFYETFYTPAATSQSDGVTYYFAGKDVVDFYKGTNDPRIGKFFSPYTGTSYEGNVFGTLPAGLSSASTTSRLGYVSEPEDPTTMIGTATKSSPLLTDFESLFIQAEAAQRTLIAGSAENLYKSAVGQSFSYMGLASVAPDYLAQPLATVSYADAGPLTADKLKLILTQKWAALNGVAPVEIWTDYRRTGYPLGLRFSVDPAKEGPGFPPIRLLYPQNELTVNNDNVVAAQQAQGFVNEFSTKIFWQIR